METTTKKEWYFCHSCQKAFDDEDAMMPVGIAEKPWLRLCLSCDANGMHLCAAPGCLSFVPILETICPQHRSRIREQAAKIIAYENWETGRYGERWVLGYFDPGTTKPYKSYGGFESPDTPETVRSILHQNACLRGGDKKLRALLIEWLVDSPHETYRSTWSSGGDKGMTAVRGWGFALGNAIRGQDTLSRSNFRSLKRDLLKEFPNDVYTGNSDIEVNLFNKALVEWLYERHQELDDYMVYDEDDWSELKTEEKAEYFNDYLYSDLQEYAIEHELPLWTMPTLVDGEREVVFLDTPDHKNSLLVASEEGIEESGDRMYFSDSPWFTYQHVFDKAESADRYWFDAEATRQRIDRLRVLMAAPHSGYYQTYLLDPPDLEPVEYYDPTKHYAVDVQYADGRCRRTYLVRPDYQEPELTEENE